MVDCAAPPPRRRLRSARPSVAGFAPASRRDRSAVLIAPPAWADRPVAIAGQVPLDLLRHAVPAYPTVSEVWLKLVEAYVAAR